MDKRKHDDNADDIVEDLNERELSILGYLAERLSNQEIANRLYISEKTVRWYNTRIYEKLGVSNRKEAGEKAHALGLLKSQSSLVELTQKHKLTGISSPICGSST